MDTIDSGMIAVALSVIGTGIAMIFAGGRLAGRIKSIIDTHGNAIGEHKIRLDAHESLHKDHIQKIARLEGRSFRG